MYLSCIIGGVLICTLSMYRGCLPGWRSTIFIIWWLGNLAAFGECLSRGYYWVMYFIGRRPMGVTSFAFLGVSIWPVSSLHVIIFVKNLQAVRWPLYALASIAVYTAVPLIHLGLLKELRIVLKLYGEIVSAEFIALYSKWTGYSAWRGENPSYFYDVLPYAYVWAFATRSWTQNLAGHIGCSALSQRRCIRLYKYGHIMIHHNLAHF